MAAAELPPVHATDFFIGTDAAHGSELWIHDAVAGDHIVADLTPGAASSNPGNFRDYARQAAPYNQVLFTATNASGERELWLVSPGLHPYVIISASTFANAATSAETNPTWAAYPVGGREFAWNLPGGRTFLADQTVWCTRGSIEDVQPIGFGSNIAFKWNSVALMLTGYTITSTDGTLAGTNPNAITLNFTRNSMWVFQSAGIVNGHMQLTFSDRADVNWSSGRNRIYANFDIDLSLVTIARTYVANQHQATIPNVPPTVPPAPTHSSLSNGVLRITGTDSRDTLEVYRSPSNPGRLVVNLQSVEQAVYDLGAVSTIQIDMGAGDDTVNIKENYGAIFANARIDGGDGNDALYGGSGNDSIYGGNGNDYIVGRDGRDRIDGGLGTDRLFGGGGKDWFVNAKTVELKDKAKSDLLII